MSEDQLNSLITEIVARVANDDTHLASVECADELATLATAGWLYSSRGDGEMAARLFKIAMALGYETRRRHESYQPLDPEIWSSALDGITGPWE